MYAKRIWMLILLLTTGRVITQAQTTYRKIDTTMKIAKTGYRVSCNNKDPLKNHVQLSPIGFEKDVRDVSFEIKGRLKSAEVDDLNGDGYPELVVYVYNNDSLPKGNVMGILSEKNASLGVIIMPDIYDDPKIRNGYKGNDVFFLMEGSLIRRFPVYPGEGTPPAAANGNLMRQIQYRVVPDERGYKFKVVRSYDYTK